MMYSMKKNMEKSKTNIFWISSPLKKKVLTFWIIFHIINFLGNGDPRHRILSRFQKYILSCVTKRTKKCYLTCDFDTFHFSCQTAS
jgi:hypothetical protein